MEFGRLRSAHNVRINTRKLDPDIMMSPTLRQTYVSQPPVKFLAPTKVRPGTVYRATHHAYEVKHRCKTMQDDNGITFGHIFNWLDEMQNGLREDDKRHEGDDDSANEELWVHYESPIRNIDLTTG